MEEPLSAVAVAISSFRSDSPVLDLLAKIFERGRSPFGAVIVVDSLGSGRLRAEVEARGWPVVYRDSDRNLGSAGNLALRLKLAAATGAGWCYAVNHDGIVDPDQVRRLLGHGRERDRIGAVYPRLLYSRRRGTLDAPRVGLTPFGAFDRVASPSEQCVEVLWSSSNCALYNLKAVRQGLSVWDDLWMGWEDFAYGWQLWAAGWTQLQCQDVTVIDSYEYRPVCLAGREIYITDKPSWYVYYQIRNLILIARRSSRQAIGWRAVASRALVEAAVTLLFRQSKLERFRLILAGVRDGLAGRAGKGAVP